jgi:hypothetical protein
MWGTTSIASPQASSWSVWPALTAAAKSQAIAWMLNRNVEPASGRIRWPLVSPCKSFRHVLSGPAMQCSSDRDFCKSAMK